MPYFLTISGSRNKFSKTAFLLRTLAKRLETQGLELRAVHAADLEQSFVDHPVPFYAGDVDQLVHQAEAIILLTPAETEPETGLLKPLLDRLPDGAFAGKPVVLLVTGGLAEHLNNLQRAYAAQFQRLHADLLRPALHVGLRAWIIVGDNPPKMARGVEDQLAEALREAQARVPVRCEGAAA